MWPKVLMQLFELLPHVTRLVPVADKYFASKAASEKATRQAMAAMTENVRDDIEQVTKAHAGLYRQLQEHGSQIAEMSEDVRRAKVAIEHQGQRLEAIDHKLDSLGIWVRTGVGMLVLLLVMVIVLLVRGH